MKKSSPKSDILRALGVSLLLIFGNSPFFIPLLPFLGFSLWFYLLKSTKKPFLMSFVIGLPYWIYHSFWIYNLDVPRALKPLLFAGVVSMALILCLIWAFWGWITSRFKGIYSVIFGAFAFSSLEFIRGEYLGDLSYPWALIGESFVKSPFLKMASIFGVYFLSFYGVLVGGFIGIKRWRLASLILLLGLIWNFAYRIPKPYDTIKVAILQPNILPRLDYDPKEWEQTFKAYREITEGLKGIDLLVASESAFPGVYKFSENSKKIVYEIVSRTNSPLLFGTAGVEKGEKEYSFFNRALLVDTDNKIIGFYDKVRLVPFGENLPFYEILPEFIRNVELGQGNYQRGRGFYPIQFKEHKLGVMICYESIFSGIGKKLADNGANVLVIITSDGWFGKSIGPVEHFHLGIPRAVETGRYIIRAAKTGISAIITPEGKVLDSLPLYVRGRIVADVG
ncbi:MAG: apolipoprotein N-acyltransferase, partial [candidate division WOR-3 bacterium]